VIPVVAGRVQLDARASLRTMPDAVATSLFKDRTELMEFMRMWGNCLDYGFGIEEAQSTPNGFAKELFKSGHQRLGNRLTSPSRFCKSELPGVREDGHGNVLEGLSSYACGFDGTRSQANPS